MRNQKQIGSNVAGIFQRDLEELEMQGMVHHATDI